MKGNLVNKSGDLVKDLVNDCISSQAAKDMIKNHKTDFSTEKDYRTAMACVNAVPPAQPGCEDVVPRTSVEYICQKNTVSTNPYEHKYHDKFIQFMDDPEISDFGRWQHSNGFNTALVAVKCDLDKVPSVTPKQPGWIPVKKRLPENEQDVLVTVEIRPVGRKPFRRVVRAFYTDGKHTDADSAYNWYELEEPDFDDDGNIIVPEGWWESSDYSEEVSLIDDFVISWREQPKPQKGEENG